MEKVWNGTAWVDRTASPYTFTGQDGTSYGLSQAEYNAANNGVTEGLASNSNQSFGDTVKSWFTPDGKSGQSVGGNVMGSVGTGVQALSGLAGMYYAKKNYDLQKDQADYLKNRDAASDTRMSKFASNAGNGASY